ncbi:xaa-Pro aminopeptidase 1 [Planococcus citri]|uniref:xaa-Pro aminopeptidase 1 n=1 Tax=Planococcus citri TaxID=170843 RepID=UPI0031F9C81B
MPKNTTGLLRSLRSLFKNTNYVSEPLHAYIVLSDDAHQNEYITLRDARREYISGFSGSAGTAIVTDTKAAMWTDGRYFLQATAELDENWTLMKEGVPETPTKEEWLGKTLPMGAKIGFDPMTMKYSLWKTLQIELEKRNQTLIPVNSNLIDLIWEAQPLPPTGLVDPLPLKYTGVTCGTKVKNVRNKMFEKNATVYLITALDEIAWLLNVRGSDIPFNPVFFSYVIVTPNDVHFFIDDKKYTSVVQQHFNDENLTVTLHPYEKVQSFLSTLLASDIGQEGKTWITSSSSYAFASMVPEKQLLTDASPIAVMKSIKNEVETEGLINAHIKDAAALCCYFAWLEKEVASGNITEISGGEYLENCRRKQEDYVGPSFDVISASGSNGAIIHYKPKPETNRVITTNELYLCDSGGQYKDGTTDVTRTLHFGSPSQYERECFTRVFKGQAALKAALFPEKVKGNVLDTLARKFLWDVGLNYLHGTGHGIGAYLNVHEGPMGISWREYPDDPGLQVGMFLSNEPGYYEDGKFGIRLENIIRIIPGEPKYPSKTRYLTFADVTLVPIQTKLLLPNLLTKEEISYLNEYHELCREKVGRLLKEQGETEALSWLMRETEPIG